MHLSFSTIFCFFGSKEVYVNGGSGKKRLTSFDVGYIRQRTDELNLLIKIFFDYNKTMKIYFRNGITKSAMIFFLALS